MASNPTGRAAPLLNRRRILAAGALPFLAPLTGLVPARARAAAIEGSSRMSAMSPDDSLDHALPSGIRQRTLHDVNGLSVRILEAGFETPGRPAILLLHGFPELAYSWRRTMQPLAAAGYHVIAPDQRGYGGTTGWDGRYDGNVASFRNAAYARDAMGVVFALGYRSVACVVGHDFGSMVAAYCALVRPDVFRSLAMVSFPFDGPPAIPFDTADHPAGVAPASLDARLAALTPPRMDSMAFFSSRGAEADMLHPPQGLPAFLRAYYHVKSADWPGNHPHPLADGSATALAALPRYYILDRNAGMAAAVAPDMPTPEQVAANRWLPDDDLAVYVRAIERTGFQGSLNWFRCQTGDIGNMELELQAGRTIDVPSCFVSGTADWGTYRKPGALDRMRARTCTRMTGVHLVEGAGHWTQQEQPERFNDVLIGFLHETGTTG